jgi:E3 ubiquitin-protein ligase MARCH6
MQAWTLGLLYMKLGSKLITSLFRHTRLAAAVRMVLRHGWLHPDIAILTRAFVVPGVVLGCVAVFGPPLVADLAIKLITFHRYGVEGPSVVSAAEAAAWMARKTILHRASYPLAASLALMTRNIAMTIMMLQGWSSKVRDEAYLIGERLHNFGVVSDASRRGRASWRARGARL